MLSRANVRDRCDCALSSLISCRVLTETRRLLGILDGMASVLEYNDVSFVRNNRSILSEMTWKVDSSERWVVLGPNGAGKSTLLKMAALSDYPSSGTVNVLGETLGKVNVFDLRPRVGVTSTVQERRVPANETVRNVVMTAAYGVLGRWTEEYDTIDSRQAERILAEWGVEELADREFGTLSDGERKRVMIARAVMTDPELLLLDEPAASLDLGARERLVQLLGGFAQSPYSPAMVLITHHVEEIPQGFTHVLLLSENGTPVAQGPIADVLTAENLEATYGMPFELQQNDGRYFATAKVSL